MNEISFSGKVKAVIDHPNDDFVELLTVAGLDPAIDLVDSDWSGIDFETADIAGWDFTGSNLSKADFRKVSNFNKAVFAGSDMTGAKLPEVK